MRWVSPGMFRAVAWCRKVEDGGDNGDDLEYLALLAMPRLVGRMFEQCS